VGRGSSAGSAAATGGGRGLPAASASVLGRLLCPPVLASAPEGSSLVLHLEPHALTAAAGLPPSGAAQVELRVWPQGGADAPRLARSLRPGHHMLLSGLVRRRPRPTYADCLSRRAGLMDRTL
jgi:hypothetical protein